jgi:hypothetical protein
VTPVHTWTALCTEQSEPAPCAEPFITVKTVETHVSKVLRKLQLSNRHELTAWALQRKLL